MNQAQYTKISRYLSSLYRNLPSLYIILQLVLYRVRTVLSLPSQLKFVVDELINRHPPTVPSPPDTTHRFLDTKTWVKTRFVENQELLSSRPSPPGFDGLDAMLLLSWVTRKFSTTD